MEYSTKLYKVKEHQHIYCPERTQPESPPLRSEKLEALHQMRNGKAPETDGILAKFGKVSGEEGVNILQHLCTLIWKSEE